MIYLQILSRYEADPAAWQAHVEGGDITPWRLTHALVARDYYAGIAEGLCKADAIRICTALYGFKTQAVRMIIRRMT